ncbi:MAG: hypothetical protein IJM44_07895 [Ruminococcus sp.]|nr:hypothetical protein [Ruminococcus sp.]
MALFNKEANLNQDPKKSRNIFILVFGLIAVICLYSGISGLLKSPQPMSNFFDGTAEAGDFVEGTPTYGFTYSYDVKHTLNYIIPLLEEHYYMIFSEDDEGIGFVRAGKDFGNNFNFTTYENYKNAEVRGAVRKFDSSISHDLAEQFNGELTTRETTYYIDTYANLLNIICVIIGVLNLVLVAASFVIFKEKDIDSEYDDLQKKRSAAGIVFGVAAFASLILLLYVIMMRF